MRVAVAGTGFFSQFHYDAWQRLGVELVGCVSLDADQAARTAKRYGVETIFRDVAEMLDATNPDLLDIVTPPTTHTTLVHAALARQTPVVCQKPFTTSLCDAQDLVRDSEVAGVTLMVHENFRFQPWYGELKRLKQSGVIGETYQIGFRLRPGDGQGPEAYLERQPYFQDMSHFLVHETAIHFIDTFRYLLGEVEWVMADLRRLNPVIAGEDAGFVIFGFENGKRGLFDGNRLVDHIAENRRHTMGEMLVEGSHGTLRLNGDGRIFIRAHGENSEVENKYSWNNKGFGGDCVYRLNQHVMETIVGDAAPINSASDYLRNIEIEEAIYRSSSEGRRVNV